MSGGVLFPFEMQLQSGAKFAGHAARYLHSSQLKNAILRCSKGAPLGVDFFKQDIRVLLEMVVEMASSEEVEKALFVCFASTTYENVKVTQELMDDPKLGENIRKDFYAMALKVIEVNCKSFFEQAFSWFKARWPKEASAPK